MSCPAAAQSRAVMACLVPSHLPNVIQLPVQHPHGLQAEGAAGGKGCSAKAWN